MRPLEANPLQEMHRRRRQSCPRTRAEVGQCPMSPQRAALIVGHAAGRPAVREKAAAEVRPAGGRVPEMAAETP
jgi:hypothetical protein